MRFKLVILFNWNNKLKQIILWKITGSREKNSDIFKMAFIAIAERLEVNFCK